MEHRLILARPFFPPRRQLLHNLRKRVGSEDDHPCKDGPALRVQLQHELGDAAEVRARAADAPEEVCVFVCVGGEDLAGGCHDCRLVFRGVSTR